MAGWPEAMRLLWELPDLLQCRRRQRRCRNWEADGLSVYFMQARSYQFATFVGERHIVK